MFRDAAMVRDSSAADGLVGSASAATAGNGRSVARITMVEWSHGGDDTGAVLSEA